MHRTRAALFGLCALAFAAPPPAYAADSALTPAQAQAVRDLVRQTLIDNPEILSEAMDALKEKRLADLQREQAAAIETNRAELVRADDPYLGAAKTPALTLVEFFDYNCGYCRHMFPDIQSVLKEHPDVRLVIKDLPVLGPDSEAVSRLALASRAQGRYAEFHTALMKNSGRLTVDAALEEAKTLKLDVAKLQADAKSKAVDETIKRNLLLAQNLGVRGTPAIVVGSTMIPGAVSADELNQEIATAKAAKAKAAK